ncbi:hypothetical protein [Hydrogenovibrio kuenenii]|uniref:hypothetical protein n=1 Tax=Hydrogenovibrio kuenenii TaxID=63658 RepID=UPI0004B22187|nr:hypothetical protein [Hydrogenovibrio kuenenii]
MDQVFLDKEPLSLTQDAVLDSLFPLKAEQRCLVCHTQAKVGDVLGVMHFRQDMRQTLSDANQRFLLFFLLLLPLPIIVAYLITLKLSGFLERVISSLHEKIEHIHKIRDLK